MERSRILMKEKLGFRGLLKESFKIFYQNPKFIFLSFLTSLPLFCCMLIHELWLQRTLVEATAFLSYTDFDNGMSLFYYYSHPEMKLVQFAREFGCVFLQLGLMYIPLVHLPDLINTIGVVNSSSVIYSGHRIINIREILSKSLGNGTLKRTLITSIYVVSMASLVFLGLLAITAQAIAFSQVGLNSSSFMYGLPFMGLLYMYIQWSSVWNLGIVASILEEKRGDVALGVSAYISRGNRRNGGLVTGVFFVWKMSLRAMSTIYLYFHQRDVRRALLVAAFQVFLICVGNVINWVIFMVFFYDCKLRFLEKKVDMEEAGKKANATQGKITDEAVNSSTPLLAQVDSKV